MDWATLGDCVRVTCKLQLSKHVSSPYQGCDNFFREGRERLTKGQPGTRVCC
jgi:hypothetical protein